MIVRNRLYGLVGKNPSEFPAPGARKIGVRATAGREEETAVRKVLSQVLDLFVTQDEIVVSVHEQERCLVEVRIGQADFPLFLDGQRGRFGDQAHQILAYAAAIITVVRTVSNAAHEKCRLFVGKLLQGRGAAQSHSEPKQNRAKRARGDWPPNHVLPVR